MSKKIEKIKPFLDPLYNIIISSLCSGILIYIVKQFPKLKFIHQPIIYIIIITLCIWIALYTTRKIQILEFLFKPLLYSVLTSLSILVIVALLLFFWYNYCFFPDDQNYLQNIVSSIEYTDDSLEETELDLIRTLNNNAKIVNPLDKSDRAFLLKGDLRMRDYYVDINPYNNKADSNNLKYSTGRIFYYIYQKNSIVLKGNSNITFSLKKSKGRRRFIEFDMVFPKFIRSSNGRGILNIYFTEKKRRLILKREIEREEKPDIKPFRYSNPISSIIFYLKHPGRSVLTDYVGWEKIKHELPCCAGMLEIEFIVKNGKRDYLFLGTPRVYAVKEKRRNDHINIVYLIFDTLSKYHIDLYEYYDIFSGKSFDDALKVLGERRITTPVIDRYVGNICLFDNIYSAGQVTRPSIVPLWTSQEYTRSRLPVFRNIVTDNNKQEFYNMKFATLADELSKYGYLTKQISCNAQGHGVSGVGVDLGFDENYDYTMEASELTENFRRIINFLEQNQNKKFFLYSHINVPHVPRWIPIRYFLSAYWDCNFISSTATILGNIRYMNDCLEKIMTTLKKLRLDKNTIVIISSDHSMGPRLNFRGEEEERDWMSILKRESQLVSSDYSHSIYVRKGWSSLYNNIVNIPWIFIAPLNLDVIPGRINSSISALDISPTLYDIATGKKNDSFKGKSFKRLLYGKDRNKSNSSFIPLVGRFQRGFVYKEIGRAHV